MSTVLLTTLFVLSPSVPAASQAAAGPKLDGNWLIVYAEEGGRRNNAWEQRLATVKGDSLTYEDESKKRTMRLKFGPHQSVDATQSEGGAAGKTHRGVYISSQDYLCISLETGMDKAHQSSGDFILIMRKQAAKPSK